MRITLDYFPKGRKKALTLSYDDGQIHDRRLVDIFNRYHVKGTFHLNSGTLDTEPFLCSSEISDLFEDHEISAHSLSHPYLTEVPCETLLDEILEDRKRLEQLAGYPVRGMSYPYGAYNQSLLKTLPVLGIEYSRTVSSHGQFTLPENFLSWHPTCHHSENLLAQCETFLKTDPRNRALLFYVWGHSFEFDRNNNWELIEAFCKRISNNDTIWYATNIEIMDYMKAVKRLRFSIERNIVCNPSSIPVWIGVEGRPMEIKPGKTGTVLAFP